MAKHGAVPDDSRGAKKPPGAEKPLAPPARKRTPARGPAATHAPAELDRLIHERMRLGIVSALAVNDALSFNDLKRLMQTTDGNLSVHARKLEDAGYVACTKSFDGRVPRTEFRLTSEGRAALRRYVDHMEALIQMAKGK